MFDNRLLVPRATGILLASDAFARSNSTNLGVTDGAGWTKAGGAGKAWAERLGNWDIESQRLRTVAGAPGANPYYIATVENGASDVYMECVSQAPAGGVHSLVARYSDNDNFYIFGYFTGAIYYIYRRQAASFVLLWSGGTAPAANTDVTLALSFQGTTLKVYAGGTLLRTETGETMNQSSVIHGVRGGNQGDVQFDNFNIWKREPPGWPNP